LIKAQNGHLEIYAR
jgi:hypothetical protein